MTERLPPIQPLVPIIDEMQAIAKKALPEPHTCRIRLWDDGTFDVHIYHNSIGDEMEVIRYDRTTSEITWERVVDATWDLTTFADGTTVTEPTAEREVRVLTTVTPPYE
ncbi:hypothetical protein [Natronorubrum daqingense]|uniref:Uncharacterized protein n=1 Tax=Natronorubrum daqingense TaxID=588898 RepID=A0A1N6ZBJ9_9EURY|nr:hypothetical protein [Natronorubrum daqingense]APX95397.1 hypothetical protein BB347_01525 [Natronorubrum daqingense]SIR24260.1 hypothetical protein SAMN05421809_0751 [Natronorubrum daqingense]